MFIIVDLQTKYYTYCVGLVLSDIFFVFCLRSVSGSLAISNTQKAK